MNSCLCSCAGPTIQWIDFIKIALPAVFVVVGWWVVHHLRGMRARRTVLYEHVTQAKNMVKAIRQNAIAFHTKNHCSERAEALLEQIAELDTACKLMPEIVRSKHNFLPSAASIAKCTPNPATVTRLRQSITMKNFDDPGRQPLSALDDQILEIREAAQSALAELGAISIEALG